MRPLSDWPIDARRHLAGVFTDIDDTLTSHGAITPAALQALAKLKAAGLIVIAITGRPIGWCEPFMAGSNALPWPVDAMVAENGAVAFVRGQNGLQHSSDVREPLFKLYQQDATTRADNALRMAQVARQVLREVPGAMLSRDRGGRETDLAFDYNEFNTLGPEAVARIMALLQSHGMHTSVSSIHVHGCFGNFNKWQGACWIVRELLGRDLATELDRWVFVGDSGNDQAMFQHFVHSAGVANIAAFAPGMRYLPHYVTPSARGAGFAEVARVILTARQS